jgi:hypothetical protein
VHLEPEEYHRKMCEEDTGMWIYFWCLLKWEMSFISWLD